MTESSEKFGKNSVLAANSDKRARDRRRVGTEKLGNPTPSDRSCAFTCIGDLPWRARNKQRIDETVLLV